LSTISQLYAHAPFMHAILPALRAIIERPWPRLVDLDLALIDWLAAQIGISTPCHRASQLDIGGDRIERLLKLCKHFGASRYISGNAARDYLDVTRFAAAGVEVAWHDYAHPIYAQQHGEFVPYLSVLDLVLNAGARSLSVLSQRGATSEVDPERAELR